VKPFAAFALSWLILASSVHAQLYSVTDLGTLGGNSGGYGSTAYGINNSGVIVGDAILADGTSDHAFSYTTAGGMVDLGTFGGTYSSASAINNAGTIVGTANTNGDATSYGFSYTTAGGMVSLGTMAGGTYSGASAINNAGTIVGIGDGTGYMFHAFVYSGGTMTDLGTLGGDRSLANGINSSGTIVGEADTGPGDTWTAFSYSGGVMTNLGTLDGPNSDSMGINDAGTIVGSADIYPYPNTHAFSFSGGTMSDLGTLYGYYYTNAYAINSSGQIVGGGSVDGWGASKYAFTVIDGVMIDLNSVLDGSGAGWTLEVATALNDNGQIVGYGVNPSGQTDAFLLNPVPEPSTCAMLIGGLGLFGLVVRRRKLHAERRA